jgi:hypothetical protein
MSHPHPVVLCLLIAGALDLLFNLGLYLVNLRYRDKGNNSLPSIPRPRRVFAMIHLVIGGMTFIAGLLLWVFELV